MQLIGNAMRLEMVEMILMEMVLYFNTINFLFGAHISKIIM